MPDCLKGTIHYLFIFLLSQTRWSAVLYAEASVQA